MTSISEAFKHVLCMDIDEHALRVAAVHKEKKSISSYQEFPLGAYDRDHVKTCLEDPFFKQEFDGYCLTVGGSRNTLVPVDIFNHSTAKNIFELTFPKPWENIDYTRIPELGIVNIAESPLWIKSSFIIKMPRTKIIHQSTAFLKGIYGRDVFKPQLHLNINTNNFTLVYTDKRKLLFHNQFNYSALSDIIYHTLNLIEQENIDQAKLVINVFGVDTSWKDLEEFKSFFKAEVKLSAVQEDSSQFILKSQILCV